MAERVWDKFLSEADREHVEVSGHTERGFGSRPALLMIDLYRWVFGDRPQPLMEAIKEWPGSCGMAGWESLPHIQRLLATAREVGMPVVHVTGLPESESGVIGWSSSGRKNFGRAGYMGGGSNREGMYDIMPEVAPIEGEAFLRKTAPSAFWGTPVAGTPERTGRRYAHRRGREHQRLRARVRRGRLHEPLPGGRCGGVRLRPAGSAARDQPVRHASEVRGRHGARRDHRLDAEVAGSGWLCATGRVRVCCACHRLISVTRSRYGPFGR